MKICYFDNFSRDNSNQYWLGALAAFGRTRHYNIAKIKDRWRRAKRSVEKFQPDHIHFGGSVKNEKLVPKEFVEWLRAKFPKTRITFFYGDAYDKTVYYDTIEPFVDDIYMTNQAYLKNEKYHFVLCPGAQEFLRDWIEDKQHNVVFIGNNYNTNRLYQIEELRQRFNITVFGNNWPEEFSAQPLPFKDYADVCSKAYIVLGDPAGPVCRYSSGAECTVGNPDKLYTRGVCRAYACQEYKELKGWLSNRFINTILCNTVHLVPHIGGLREYWGDNQGVVWYETMEERDQAIHNLLENKDRCKEIAEAGQRKAMDYTFDRVAALIVKQS